MSQLPAFYQALTGLEIDAQRLPTESERESWRCAHSPGSNCYVMKLKVSGSEQRDGLEGYILLVLNRDPIVINGWRNASLQESSVTNRHEVGAIERAVRQAAPSLGLDPATFHLSRRVVKTTSRDSFEQEYAKNPMRARYEMKSKVDKMFRFLRPKPNTMLTMGRFLQDTLDGKTGPRYTKRLEVQVRRSAKCFMLHFSNRRLLPLRNVHVRKEDMLELLAPGFKTDLGARFAGFNYAEWPAEADIPDGVTIDKLAGGESVEVEWPSITFYQPVSRKLFVSYEIGTLGWKSKFFRYAYADSAI